MTTAPAARLLECLVEQLTTEGDITADWRETFLAVLRHLFLLDTVWQQDPAIDGPIDLVAVHRRESPDRWLEIAYANRSVTVLAGDGALGHGEKAPYDRVLCTASVQQVPPAWVAQTRPGGRVLTPWANAYFDGDCWRWSHTVTAAPPAGSSARHGSCGYVRSGCPGSRSAGSSGTTSASRSQRPGAPVRGGRGLRRAAGGEPARAGLPAPVLAPGQR
ncbi:MAG: hypothetical protein ACRDRA_02215 [Pseudonocardiaceae bacterium]